MIVELHGWIPALLGALSAFADAILGVGVIVPGEVAVTGLAVTMDGDQLAVFVVLVAGGATLGDHMNYGLGRWSGPRLAGSRVVVALGVQHWRRAASLMDRHGPRAIVLTRLIPVVRTLVPAVAGAAGLPYHRFLPASLMGSLLWAVTWVLAASVVMTVVTRAGLLAASVAGALAVVVYFRKVR